MLLEHPKIDPSANENEAVRCAAKHGHAQVVELLLKHPNVDPSTNDNYAIRYAATYGHAQVVGLLLEHPKVYPSANYNEAIREAINGSHWAVVDLLLNNPKMHWIGDWSNVPGVCRESIMLRCSDYARKRRASRTIVRYLYDKFESADNLHHHIWKPNGYLSRKLALEHCL
jgi:ankyrin repeat protein